MTVNEVAALLIAAALAGIAGGIAAALIVLRFVVLCVVSERKP